jgi:signal transduction histidine kinase
MISSQTNPDTGNREFGKLRNQLFLNSALLSSVILVVAAYVINNQFVAQARVQVQAEVETLLPLYDAVWSEQARRLGAVASTIANSPIVKAVLGDARASRDRQTLREMIADAGSEIERGEHDLILVTDGAGQVISIEPGQQPALEIAELPSARVVGESQKPQDCFVLLGTRLYHLALTPVVLHSADAAVNHTLAVIAVGAELDRQGALDIKGRIHSETAFFVGDRLHASSFEPEVEPQAAQAIKQSPVINAEASRPVELDAGGDVYLAFARRLPDPDGKPLGEVIVLRSLAGAGQMFRAISNRLLALWTLALAAAWLLSYLLANRITRPLEALARSARELGKGNYDFPIPSGARGEVGQLARAFDQMRDSLKTTQFALLRSERLATIGQMASSIIHDLRNPLATISTAAEVLKSDRLAPDRRQTMIDTQLRASGRMSAMLSEILDFSRGQYKLDRRVQSLRTIVDRVTRELNPQLAQLDIQLISNIPQHIRIDVDGERVERVFWNLLVNAIQAMSQKGRIEISAAIKDGVVRIDLVDDGPGVPAEIRERLFEPFISHGKQGGTGLGLAIARGVIEAHRGRIGYLETKERGAHFFIELKSEPSTLDREGSYAEESLVG